MKAKKILLLEKILRIMASAVLFAHKPKIIAITGSVGKTSTKDAVLEILKETFNVRENKKNYNNEIGIPLTIIGAETGGRSVGRWLNVLLVWVQSFFDRKYPDILILEMGIDRIGDMRYLTSFIKPNIGIVTNVSTSHIEHFKTIDNIAKEKGVLIEHIQSGGWAILNADDERVAKMHEKTKAHIITFGKDSAAAVSASNISYVYKDAMPDGISFKLNYAGKNIPVRLKNVLAEHSVYSALSAISVGIACKLNLLDIIRLVENITPPIGRTHFFEGVRGSFLIDDTYNASPKSTLSALSILEHMRAKRKIAILGDMLELGNETELGHREIGKKLAEIGIDVFVAVGRRMRFAAEEMEKNGFAKESILFFEDPLYAAEIVPALLQKGDLVLVKGSQGMRMEKIVEKVLADYARDGHLLCRQTADWKKKAFIEP